MRKPRPIWKMHNGRGFVLAERKHPYAPEPIEEEEEEEEELEAEAKLGNCETERTYENPSEPGERSRLKLQKDCEVFPEQAKRARRKKRKGRRKRVTTLEGMMRQEDADRFDALMSELEAIVREAEEIRDLESLNQMKQSFARFLQTPVKAGTEESPEESSVNELHTRKREAAKRLQERRRFALPRHLH